MWIDKKNDMDTSGGVLRRSSGRRSRPRPPEPTYSVAQVAEIFSVSKATVRKWLSIDFPEDAVIPPDGWFKLPRSGYIRIKHGIITSLKNELSST